MKVCAENGSFFSDTVGLAAYIRYKNISPGCILIDWQLVIWYTTKIAKLKLDMITPSEFLAGAATKQQAIMGNDSAKSSTLSVTFNMLAPQKGTAMYVKPAATPSRTPRVVPQSIRATLLEITILEDP